VFLADLAPKPPTEDHCAPTAPFPSSTSNLQFGFNHLKLRSPTKLKYSSEEEKVLSRLILTKADIINTREGLDLPLKQSPFNKVPNRSLGSLRNKIRDMKKKKIV